MSCSLSFSLSALSIAVVAVTIVPVPVPIVPVSVVAIISVAMVAVVPVAVAIVALAVIAVIALAMVTVVPVVAVIIVIVIIVVVVRDCRAHQEAATADRRRVCAIGETVTEMPAQAEGSELIARSVGEAFRGRERPAGNTVCFEENEGLPLDAGVIGIGQGHATFKAQWRAQHGLVGAINNVQRGIASVEEQRQAGEIRDAHLQRAILNESGGLDAFVDKVTARVGGDTNQIDLGGEQIGIGLCTTVLDCRP